MSNLKKYGWKPDVPDHRDVIFNHLSAPVPTPDKVDLRPGMPAVYDQGDLGSCTANAAGAAFQFDQIKSKQPNWIPSRLYIYYLERKLEGSINSDAGAQIRDAVKVMATYGVIPESVWPYVPAKFRQAPTTAMLKLGSFHQALTYARVGQTQDAIEQCIAKGYPMIFGFTVFAGFESQAMAKSGMLPMPTPGEKPLGGHAVLACGYDRTKRLLTVRNSWGPTWGDKGYFYMPYEYITNPNLADDLWAVYSVENSDGK
jgi:C1A family cysteine protease